MPIELPSDTFDAGGAPVLRQLHNVARSDRCAQITSPEDQPLVDCVDGEAPDLIKHGKPEPHLPSGVTPALTSRRTLSPILKVCTGMFRVVVVEPSASCTCADGPVGLAAREQRLSKAFADSDVSCARIDGHVGWL